MEKGKKLSPQTPYGDFVIPPRKSHWNQLSGGSEKGKKDVVTEVREGAVNNSQRGYNIEVHALSSLKGSKTAAGPLGVHST